MSDVVDAAALLAHLETMEDRDRAAMLALLDEVRADVEAGTAKALVIVQADGGRPGKSDEEWNVRCRRSGCWESEAVYLLATGQHLVLQEHTS